MIPLVYSTYSDQILRHKVKCDFQGLGVEGHGKLLFDGYRAISENETNSFLFLYLPHLVLRMNERINLHLETMGSGSQPWLHLEPVGGYVFPKSSCTHIS